MRLFVAGPARAALERRALCDRISLQELAMVVGLDRRTLRRIYDRDMLRADSADLIAVALGHHPSELWPDWFNATDVPEQVPVYRLPRSA